MLRKINNATLLWAQVAMEDIVTEFDFESG